MNRYFLFFILSILLCSCTNFAEKDTNSYNSRQFTTFTQVTNKEIQNAEVIPVDIKEETNPSQKELLLPNKKNILNTIEEICLTTREFGSEGEVRTLKYLEKELSKYGYETKRDEFPVYENISHKHSLKLRVDNLEKVLGYASNLIVIKKSTENKSSENFLVTAHYDTTPKTVGVLDNATGVASVLEIARILAKQDLPFDVKFIFWGAEEPGCIGSRNYIRNLSEYEKSQILGAINIDIIGEKPGGDIVLSTKYSNPNILSLAFNEFLDNTNQPMYKIEQHGFSDDYYLYKNSIPVFTLINKKDSSIQFLSYDEQIERLNIDMIVDAVEIISEFILNLDTLDLDIEQKEPIILTNMDSPNVDFQQSSSKLKDLTLPGFTLEKIYIKLINGGSASELVMCFSNDIGEKYSISRIPCQLFDPEKDENMNECSKRKIFQDEMMRYYYKLEGSEKILKTACNYFETMVKKSS